MAARAAIRGDIYLSPEISAAVVSDLLVAGEIGAALLLSPKPESGVFSFLRVGKDPIDSAPRASYHGPSSSGSAMTALCE